MAKLTDKAIKALKATDKDQFVGDGNGLYMRVTVAGSQLWTYRYKDINGKTRWLDLGTYPAKSLAVVRSEAALLKLQRRDGLDPKEERGHQVAKKKAEASAEVARLASLAARLTVNALFDHWMSIEVSKRADNGAEMKRMFTVDVLPHIGPMAAEDVRKSDVARIIDRVMARGGNGRMAAVVLASVRQMFLFAVERDFIVADPTASIRKNRIHKPTERDRALSNSEIRQLIQLLPQAGLAEQSKLSILAMLSTACRVGELSKALIDDVDLSGAKWRIPAENAKNRKEHTISLSIFSHGIFTELKNRAERIGSKWLLPATNKSGPVCEKSLSKQIGDRQRLNKSPMKGRSAQTDSLILPGGDWRSHDLRRTAATLMAEIGVRPDVVERCLNHKEPNRMQRIYQRHSYEIEMRRAWNQLGDRLTLLTKADDLQHNRISDRP
jgi:integrase